MVFALAIAAGFVIVYGLFIVGIYFLTTATEQQRARFRQRGILTIADITSTRVTDEQIFVDYVFVDLCTQQRFAGQGRVASLPSKTGDKSRQVEIIYVADNPRNSGIVTNWFEPHEVAALRAGTSK
jgi:Na+-transporting NADH:ubiquinone oxidoreductase subunit NqrC